jgi:hypothetical protein
MAPLAKPVECSEFLLNLFEARPELKEPLARFGGRDAPRRTSQELSWPYVSLKGISNCLHGSLNNWP